MTRLSTGYTFLNIQEHCKYIVKNLDGLKTYNIGKKYEILDKIFLKVLKNNAQRMPSIFFEIFNSSSETSIKFHNLDLILGFLPKGSYLVGGYLRDIILGRKTEKLEPSKSI